MLHTPLTVRLPDGSYTFEVRGMGYWRSNMGSVGDQTVAVGSAVAPVMPSTDTSSVEEPSQTFGTFDASNSLFQLLCIRCQVQNSGVTEYQPLVQGAVTADSPTRL